MSTSIPSPSTAADPASGPAAAVPSAPQPVVPAPWSRRTELAFAFLLGAAAMLLLDAAWQRGFGAPQPARFVNPAALDLNTAEEAELAQLPGFGPHRARRIIEHRENAGHFSSVDDLERVDGLGSFLVEKARPALRVGGAAPAAPLARRPAADTPSTHPLIDLNTASAQELQRIPGVGPVLAQRIITFREEQGPFRAVEELTRIQGIKEKMLAKIRPYATVLPVSRPH